MDRRAATARTMMRVQVGGGSCPQSTILPVRGTLYKSKECRGIVSSSKRRFAGSLIMMMIMMIILHTTMIQGQ